MANRTLMLLVVGYAAALGLGAYELRRDLSPPPSPVGQSARTPPALEMPPAPITNLAAYDPIIEHPLFEATRRPQTDDQDPGDAAAPDGQPETIMGVRLTAVLKLAESTTALFEDQAGQTWALHQGERLGQWQIEEILDDRVTMVTAGKRKTLVVHQFDAAANSKNAQTVLQRVTQRTPRAPLARPPVIRRTVDIPKKP